MKRDHCVYRELAVVVGAALLCALVILVGREDGTLVSVIAGFLLALFLPGYPVALIVVRFMEDSRFFVRIVLGMAFSMFICIGITMLIQYSPFSITAGSVTWALLACIILASGIVLYLSKNRP